MLEKILTNRNIEQACVACDQMPKDCEHCPCKPYPEFCDHIKQVIVQRHPAAPRPNTK